MKDPERLGKYRIKGILGEGGMGLVYHGFDDGPLQRDVAIKTIRRGLLRGKAGAELRERFQREAQAEGRLGHPNIVGIYEYQEDEDGDPFFVMEFVEGQSLKEYLSRGMHFNLDMSLHIVSQVLSALAYSHKQGIIHRDIKPANILLLEDNSVKIADFGIARIEESEYTQTGRVMGTPQYFSPEQSQGRRTDARSDLYSAAVVLYELLSGEKLLPREAAGTRNRRLTEEQLTKLENHPPDAVRTLKAVLTRALANNPEERFQSAADFAKALQPLMVLAEEPVRRNRRWVGVTAGLGVAFFLALSFLLWQHGAPGLGLPWIVGDLINGPERAPLPPEAQVKVDRYLKIGEIHFSVGRLILPEGSNAYHAFKLALDVDPHNDKALTGMENVQEKVLRDVQQLADDGQVDIARTQLNRAQQLFPDNRRLRGLAREIGEER